MPGPAGKEGASWEEVEEAVAEEVLLEDHASSATSDQLPTQSLNISYILYEPQVVNKCRDDKLSKGHLIISIHSFHENTAAVVSLPGLCRIWGTKAGLSMGGRTGGTGTDTSHTVSGNQTSKGKV